MPSTAIAIKLYEFHGILSACRKIVNLKKSSLNLSSAFFFSPFRFFPSLTSFPESSLFLPREKRVDLENEFTLSLAILVRFWFICAYFMFVYTNYYWSWGWIMKRRFSITLTWRKTQWRIFAKIFKLVVCNLCQYPPSFGILIGWYWLLRCFVPWQIKSFFFSLSVYRFSYIWKLFFCIMTITRKHTKLETHLTIFADRRNWRMKSPGVSSASHIDRKSVV